MTIRVGLIGFGLSGRVFHAPFIVHDAGMALTAVCSRQADEVLKVAPAAKVLTSAQDLIEDTAIDLVVITTPNDLHYPLAKAALLAGKHVLLEKPSVTELAHIEALCLLAQQQNLVLCVYQNRRFDGDFKRLTELLKSGELGQLKHLESRFDRFRPQAQDRWRELPGKGTGIFWDLGPHLLDQVLLLLGAPSWVQASTAILRDKGQTTDWFEVELGYGDKSVRLASSPFEAGIMRRFKAGFTAGSWHCDGLDPQEEALRAGQMPWHDGFPTVAPSQVASRYSLNTNLADTHGAIHRQSETPEAGSYTQFYQQLRLAILGQGQAPVSLRHACELIYTLELLEASADQGQRLDWRYSAPVKGDGSTTEA